METLWFVGTRGPWIDYGTAVATRLAEAGSHEWERVRELSRARDGCGNWRFWTGSNTGVETTKWCIANLDTFQHMAIYSSKCKRDIVLS